MPCELLSAGEGRVMVLAFASADGRHLLSPPIYAAGVEALNAAADSAEVDAVVLTGTGSHFSWGEDLDALKASIDPRNLPSDDLLSAPYPDAGLRHWIEAMATFPKPLIAAVEGTAAGAGAALVFACDLIVASSDAEFSVPHKTWGLMPAPGIAWHAVRMLPAVLASELLLDDMPIAALRFQAAGAINRIVPPGATRAEAIAWAERLVRFPAALVSDIKESISAARDLPLDAHLARDHQRRLHHLHREATQRALARHGVAP